MGKSAYKGTHAQFGALRRFLDLVEDGTVPRGSYLIVESLDRLSREAVLDALPRLLDLIAAGITVVTLVDGQEYSDSRLRSDPSPLIMSLLIMMRAHEESKTKGLRVGNAWAQKRLVAQETGQAMTAIAPGWIKLVGGPRRGRYELIEERAAIVRGIFADTIAGHGRRTIAKRLNAAGVDTWGTGKKRGERWHDSYVQKILGNPASFGRFEPLGKLAGGDGTGNVVLDDYYPAAITAETFYAAQAASGTRKSGEGRPSESHRNILRGLAKCGDCGSNLVIVDKGARSSGPKLICGNAHASAGCDNRRYSQYSTLEMGVLWSVGDAMDRLIASSRDRSATVRLERDAMIAKRNDQQKQLDRLIELVAESGNAAAVGKRVAALSFEIATADADIARLEAQVGAAEGADGTDEAAAFTTLMQQLRETEGDELVAVRATVAQRLRGLVDRVVVGNGEAVVVMIDGGQGYVSGF